MEVGALIIFAAVLIFASHLFAWIFSHTKIPDALLLICVGLLAGPIFQLIPEDFFGQATEMAVMLVLVIVLFEGGLDLKYSTIKQAWRSTIGLAIINYLVTTTVVSLVLWGLFGFAGLIATVVGSIVGGSSSVVVIPLLEQIKMQDKAKATLTMESVFSDVLVIVITIALLAAWRSGKVEPVAVIFHIFFSFIGAGLLGVIAAFVWSRLLNLVRPMQNSVFTTPAFLLLLFGVTEQLTLSGPIAALAFGVVMGNMAKLNHYLEKEHPFLRYTLWSSTLSNKERLFFSEAAFLLQTFFFFFVGLSMRAEGIKALMIGLALSILIMIFRPMIVKLVIQPDVTIHDASIMSVMIPKGLSAAALATLPIQLGIERGEMILTIVYSVILFSIILTSLLIFALYRTRLRFTYAAWLDKQITTH